MYNGLWPICNMSQGRRGEHNREKQSTADGQYVCVCAWTGGQGAVSRGSESGRALGAQYSQQTEEQVQRLRRNCL